MWLSKKLFAVSFAELGVFGLGSSYSNLMLVGLPIISARLGDDALLPLFLLVSVHSAVLFFVAAITVESGENNGRSPRYIALRTSKNLGHNPIVIGLTMGALFNLLSIPLPQPLASAIDILSEATLPCSLFVLGGSLTAFKITGHFLQAGLIIGFKLALQPILVWILVFPVLNMDPLWRAVAVMAAGMPIGVSAYIYARNYHVGIAALSTAVLLSTILAIFSQFI